MATATIGKIILLWVFCQGPSTCLVLKQHNKFIDHYPTDTDGVNLTLQSLLLNSSSYRQTYWGTDASHPT